MARWPRAGGEHVHNDFAVAIISFSKGKLEEPLGVHNLNRERLNAASGAKRVI